MVVQSVRFQHTNVIHSDPVTAVDFFNRWAVDEIVLLDVSRDLLGREKFYDAIIKLAKKCFVPLTAGGWITSVEEIRTLLRCGADKVTLNTHAVRRPEFIRESATIFGNQCIVVSIDVKAKEKDGWEVIIDRGRQGTELSPFEWATRVEGLGAGEIFLTSIDRDGTNLGYDLELVRGVVDVVDIPVIAFGGVSTWAHLVDGITVVDAGR